MAIVREPLLNLVPIEDLRPTQITVGIREVKLMRKRWRSRTSKKEASFLGHHMIPVVLGPKRRSYIIDHHHLCRALHEEGQTEVLVTIVADLDRLDRDQFWSVLDHRGWMYPFNKEGRRRPYSDIPKSV